MMSESDESFLLVVVVEVIEVVTGNLDVLVEDSGDEEETEVKELAGVEEEPLMEELGSVEEEPLMEELGRVEEEPLMEELGSVVEEDVEELVSTLEEEETSVEELGMAKVVKLIEALKSANLLYS